MRLICFATCALFGLTAASPRRSRSVTQYTLGNIQPSNELQWYPCYDLFQCARLETPLDYKKPNSTRANVPLVKFTAQSNSTQGPYQGMVLINPGGPGGSGTTLLLNEAGQVATELQEIIGTNYDLVGFDPRGIGYAYPSANCSNITPEGSPEPPLSRRHAVQNNVTKRLTAPQLDERFFNQSLEIAQNIGQQCQAAIGGDDQIGQHMSSVSVATDMKLIVEAFAQTDDGKRAAGNASRLNFWGLSYGTILGMTFASNYPEVVGNMVLDGNLDPYDYFSGLVNKSIYYTDDIMSNFMLMCSLADAGACAFATGTSPDDVYDRFESFIWNFDAKRAYASNWTNASDISQSLALIKSTISNAVVQPIDLFPSLAQALVGWEQVVANNFSLDAMLEVASQAFPSAPSFPGDMTARPEWGTAVFCSEVPSVYGKPLSYLKQYKHKQEKQSVLQGDIFVQEEILQCLRWPITSTWKYTGPFKGRTSSPIQFVANTFDPETPIEDSQFDASQWDGAKLITIDGLGHTSLFPENQCGYQAINQYFQTGQPIDMFCKFETGPWNVTVDKLQPQPRYTYRLK